MNTINITPNIQADQRNGNLHIKLFGDFDHDFVQDLTRTIRHQYRGAGNIFVNTEKVERILPEGQAFFKEHLSSTILPHDHIYLIGKKGLEIGTQGSKVIVRKKKTCCGRCKNCSCQQSGKEKPEGEKK